MVYQSVYQCHWYTTVYQWWYTVYGIGIPPLVYHCIPMVVYSVLWYRYTIGIPLYITIGIQWYTNGGIQWYTTIGIPMEIVDV